MTRAFAPASIGNLSLGFDILGAAIQPLDENNALGDIVEVSDSNCDSLTISGPFAKFLPSDPDANIVAMCRDIFRHACEQRQISIPPLKMHLDKRLPVGSGLGSSASSIVAALSGLNAHCSSPFDSEALLKMMGKCEGSISGSVHYDNVAPSYLGGMTMMTGLDSPLLKTLPSAKGWYWTVCYSGQSVSTAQARAILPKQISLSDTLKFGQRIAVFVDALHTDNLDIAAQMIVDVVAEPHRKKLLPGFEEAKRASLEFGALAFGISGSGPTVFAVSKTREIAQKISVWLAEHYVTTEYGFSHVCTIPEQGVRVTQQSV